MSKKARDILIYFAYLYNGDYQAILNAIRIKQAIDESKYETYMAEAANQEIITIIDMDYPSCFKIISQPPICLFLKGDKSLLENLEFGIGVVGTRSNSDYGKKKTFEIVSELVKHNYLIISGLAKGIDGFAHEAALQSDGKTIGVLGCGINYIYPSTNKHLYEEIATKGLLISEYPNMTKPEPDYFKFRNRLIAALSRAILVIEAKYRSGTIITVGYALEKGAEIFCLPERAGCDSGCNKLIQDGASLVESANDVIRLWPR